MCVCVYIEVGNRNQSNERPCRSSRGVANYSLTPFVSCMMQYRVEFCNEIDQVRIFLSERGESEVKVEVFQMNGIEHLDHSEKKRKDRAMKRKEHHSNCFQTCAHKISPGDRRLTIRQCISDIITEAFTD